MQRRFFSAPKSPEHFIRATQSANSRWVFTANAVTKHCGHAHANTQPNGSVRGQPRFATQHTITSVKFSADARRPRYMSIPSLGPPASQKQLRAQSPASNPPSTTQSKSWRKIVTSCAGYTACGLRQYPPPPNAA